MVPQSRLPLSRAWLTSLGDSADVVECVDCLAGSLITGDDSSHGSEDAAGDSVSQHFPAAVASSEASYAHKFGHYSHDSRIRSVSVSPSTSAPLHQNIRKAVCLPSSLGIIAVVAG